MKKEKYFENAAKSKQRGLQKFTDSEFLDRLLKKTKIGNEDLQRLTPRQLILFNDFFVETYNNANGERKDELLEKVIENLPEKTRNQIWETNHNNIMNSIIDYIHTCGGMPTKTRIAEYTGLSRQTVDKHFKEFQSSPLYKGIDEQFKFMIPKVLAEVLRQVIINQDMRAAKLFLDFTGGSRTNIKNQNNYLQINGIMITEDMLSKLQPEQLQTIEAVLQSVNNDKS